MKKLIFVLVIGVLGFKAHGQEFDKPADGKVLIYFVRVSGTGAMINFKYFDGDKYLGKSSGRNYFTYECDPGEHLFWVAAENRDYVAGNLERGATYVLEVMPTMGAFKAAVKLNPVSPQDARTLKRIKKVLAKKDEIHLFGQEEDMDFFIKNGLERYEKIKDNVKMVDTQWKF